jgi:predicted homoserine dehydrogenase-like protein
MIIIDTALQKLDASNKPIRVGMIGAGFMARGIARQISTTSGMKLVAVSNRTLAHVYTMLDEIGDKDCVILKDPMKLCESKNIDVVVEATGNVEFSSHVVLAAIKNKKHVVLMNAELDGTVGPILKVYADKAGVIVTNVDGDQPGVIMNLYRFVKGIGFKPVLCGNIKGFHDRYRNPTTQEVFAVKWGQNAAMITSFTDGTKISFEQAVVANATGMRVAQRGMYGPVVPVGTPVTDAANWYPEESFQGAGIVDYVVGASPSPGVFVIGKNEDKAHQHFLRYYKMGDGPYYVFYTPYHLCHFEVPNTIARAALFNDAAITPAGKPMVSVIAAAKIDLKKGDVLDGIGHYATYGLCEDAETTIYSGLLPMGIAEGCRLIHDIPKDQVLTYSDVELPVGRLVDRLYIEQRSHFFPIYDGEYQ